MTAQVDITETGGDTVGVRGRLIGGLFVPSHLLEDEAGDALFVSGNPGSQFTPGGLKPLSATLTRQANTTPYTQYDLLLDASGVATEFAGAVRGSGEAIRIERFGLCASNPLARGRTIRVYFWQASPTLTVADNASFNPSDIGVLGVASVADCCGAIDVFLNIAGVAGACGWGVPAVGPAITIKPTTGTSFWVTYEIRDLVGYTPTSAGTFIGTAEGQWA